MQSIFTNPYKYRESSKKNDLENYLTELFAGVLRKDRDFLKDFLLKIGCPFENLEEVKIRTQTSRKIKGKKLRPDIQIEIGIKHIILIENKVDSFERSSQLSDYCEILNSIDLYTHKHLVYISKFKEFKVITASNIIFKEVIWKEIAEIGFLNGLLARELALFINEKKIAMNGKLSYLDALVLENIGDVFEKLDYVLNTVHNYHKRLDVLGIRLDSGKSISSIKQYGYYISGKEENIELIIGFMGSPIEVLYRIQGDDIDQKLIDNLVNEGWMKSINDKQIQIDKKEKLSKFMTRNGDEIDLIIEFLRSAIKDFKKFR